MEEKRWPWTGSKGGKRRAVRGAHINSGLWCMGVACQTSATKPASPSEGRTDHRVGSVNVQFRSLTGRPCAHTTQHLPPKLPHAVASVTGAAGERIRRLSHELSSTPLWDGILYGAAGSTVHDLTHECEADAVFSLFFQRRSRSSPATS